MISTKNSEYKLQHSSAKSSRQQQNWEAQMRNVVLQASTRFKIFLNFWLLLRSWAQFSSISARSSAKANKWCKALSSILLSQVARRAKIQGLTKCVIFDFHFQFQWSVSRGSSGDTFQLKSYEYKLQYSSVKASGQQQNWQNQMRNVVLQGSTRFKIFFNFWVLLGSWATVLKHFGAQQRKSKWCKALSSVLISQVARRAEIQHLTKHMIFIICFKLLVTL